MTFIENSPISTQEAEVSLDLGKTVKPTHHTFTNGFEIKSTDIIVMAQEVIWEKISNKLNDGEAPDGWDDIKALLATALDGKKLKTSQVAAICQLALQARLLRNYKAVTEQVVMKTAQKLNSLSLDFPGAGELNKEFEIMVEEANSMQPGIYNYHKKKLRRDIRDLVK